MKLLREKIRCWRNCLILGVMAMFSSSCGLIEDSASEALTEALGSLNLNGTTLGVSSATVRSSSNSSATPAQLSGGYYLADETIIKVTYALLSERQGTVAADGSWSLPGLAGDTPFSMTVFSNKVPVCTYSFKAGDNYGGSVSFQEKDIDIGSAKCVDGQAEVDTETLSDVSDGYVDKIKSGKVAADVLEYLVAGEGLQVVMISMFDEFAGEGFRNEINKSAQTQLYLDNHPSAGGPGFGDNQGGFSPEQALSLIHI